MVKNGWTKRIEQLERENAELKATVKLLTDEIVLLKKEILEL